MKKNTKIIIGVVIGILLFALAFETTVLSLVTKNFGISLGKGNEGILKNLEYLETLIEQNYLFDYTQDDLETGIYRGLLEGLDDPYSVYYTSEEYQRMMESTEGEYSGIGAVLTKNMNTGLITVLNPYEGMPAADAGLLPGDVLIKVGGVEVDENMDLSTLVTYVKGEQDTSVSIEIFRPEDGQYHTYQVMRKKIELPTVSYEMLEDSIAYIKIEEFDEITVRQFMDAMSRAEAENTKGLILDVRNNPGGLVPVVCEMLDYIVPDGEVLVSMKDRDGKGRSVKGSDGHSFDKPLAVLVNESSASAAEIFSGGIQDYKAGKLVGTKTFGKGIVQRIYPVGEGAGVKLTIQEYYLPGGDNIHGVGITPDVTAELPEELKYKLNVEKEQDTQLQKALEILGQEIGRLQ